MQGRTRIAATVTEQQLEAAVEVAAQAIRRTVWDQVNGTAVPWADTGEGHKRSYREQARAALEAAGKLIWNSDGAEPYAGQPTPGACCGDILREGRREEPEPCAMCHGYGQGHGCSVCDGDVLREGQRQVDEAATAATHYEDCAVCGGSAVIEQNARDPLYTVSCARCGWVNCDGHTEAMACAVWNREQQYRRRYDESAEAARIRMFADSLVASLKDEDAEGWSKRARGLVLIAGDAGDELLASELVKKVPGVAPAVALRTAMTLMDEARKAVAR